MSDEMGGGPDPKVVSALSGIDPASRDPGYWLRFHGSVLRRAAPELARRRLMADVSIVDVMAAWARTLVPVAALAAALAAITLFRGIPSGASDQAAVGVEELLVAGFEDETIPVLLNTDDPAAAVLMAAGRF